MQKKGIIEINYIELLKKRVLRFGTIRALEKIRHYVFETKWRNTASTEKRTLLSVMPFLIRMGYCVTDTTYSSMKFLSICAPSMD